MKRPKNPKYKSTPKMPKASASSQTWDNFNKKVEEVRKHNQKLKSEHDKEMKAFDSEMKKRAAIKDKARKVKSF